MRVPDAELSVLKVLWERGPSTIREIAEILYPEGETAQYATVQKLLERLQARKCVSRRSQGKAHIYRARIEREDLILDRLRDTAEKLCEGSMSPLLTHLVDASDLSQADLKSLRQIIQRAENSARGRKRK